MAKYRKKPVVVEAVQFTEENKDQVYNQLSGDRHLGSCNGCPVLLVRTSSGNIAFAAPGDWIIYEEEPGKYYPCTPEIFQATYEKVDG